MNTATHEQIVSYIQARGQARPHDLVLHTGLSSVAIHRHLKRLIAQDIIQKNGSAPLVFYTMRQSETGDLEPVEAIAEKLRSTIEQSFLHITPQGQIQMGLEGFLVWHSLYKKNESVQHLAQLYNKYIHTSLAQRNVELSAIDATKKVQETFQNAALDALFYYDTYSIPIFGRTKWARLLMYAKQSENTGLVPQIAQVVRPSILALIHHYKIEAISYIPPTIDRPIQFMDVFARELALQLPVIPLIKVIPYQVAVPQKSLSTLSERIQNARSSIFVNTQQTRRYSRVLLIDDVVGSGASFEEVAKKLKQVEIGTEHICAFAVVGSIRGYDVIRQI